MKACADGLPVALPAIAWAASMAIVCAGLVKLARAHVTKSLRVVTVGGGAHCRDSEQ